MSISQRAWILAAALGVGLLAAPAAAQLGGPPAAYDQGRLSRSAVFLFGMPVPGLPFGYGWPPPVWGAPFGLPVFSVADPEYRPLSAAAGDDFPPAPAGLPNVVTRRADAPVSDEDEPSAPRKVRVANAEATARALQFIEYGDARFQRQEFLEAYQRYRKAADAAPNLADAYFRQGFAQSALGRYLPAVKSIRRGLALQPDWPKADFRLDRLYLGNRAAKQMHFERLAIAAEENPDNAEMMYLLGVELFFDRQPDRAHTFLQAAAGLGLDAELVRGFIEAAARQSKRRAGGEEL
ncbi:MAG TPA: hypothetical protein VHC22_02550 [Pirellulales bacterium]|nr:hypothetical protein [Pirellulales bacterium]